jgi:hypothetical protein
VIDVDEARGKEAKRQLLRILGKVRGEWKQDKCLLDTVFSKAMERRSASGKGADLKKTKA